MKHFFMLFAVAAGLSGADYFPLEAGNTWTYRNFASGALFTVQVGTAAFVDGKLYHSLQGYAGTNVLARVDESNTLVYRDNDGGVDRPLLSFTPMGGAWLNAPYRPCEQESQAQERKNTYFGPLGQYTDVVSVQFRSFHCADAGTQLEQFAENIGMLRRVEQSIAGPQQYDLVFARVGRAVLNGLPTGIFSVTLDQVNGSENVTAVMRLQLQQTGLLKLNFASGQEYDVALVDESGAVEWQWSGGKFFTQAAHDRTVSMEWTIAVEIPRPRTQSAQPQLKTYTLQAWLTTAGATPQFAASLPVTIVTRIP